MSDIIDVVSEDSNPENFKSEETKSEAPKSLLDKETVRKVMMLELRSIIQKVKDGKVLCKSEREFLKKAGMDDEYVQDEPETKQGELVVPEDTSRNNIATVEYRTELIRKKYDGHECLIDKLRAEGKDDIVSQASGIVREMSLESDKLVGSEMIESMMGNFRDAAVISFKRVEALEKVNKSLQMFHNLKSDKGIDVDSPSMRVVFFYFMKCVKEVITNMGLGDEVNDIFFRMLGERMNSWKKELQDEIESLREGIEPQ